MTEKCIMPGSTEYSNVRYPGLERHEIFFGRNRKRSIEDGLVVFLTPEKHRGFNGAHGSGSDGIAFNKKLKQLGQRVAMEYYGWTVEDFRKRYGKSYL
ncbi:MAG: hypothetical protein K6F88_03415 [Ruminococcus sp.]|nr:hypothetical protein [Ruminococcus sp.]